MDAMNRNFQLLLENKNFPMQIVEEDEQFIFKGRLSVTEDYVVDFAVSLLKSDDHTPGQIIFNNVAYMNDGETREQWLEWINTFNLHHGLYYYFALEQDGRLFARHVTEVFHVEDFFNVLSKGGHVIRHVLSVLNEFREIQ